MPGKKCKSGHRLYRKENGQPYVCNGCKTSGQGLTYRCEACDFDLHKECMNSVPLISPETFKGYEFKFFPLPPPGNHKACKKKKYCLKCRNCDACGLSIKGYVYHCKETDTDLHPRCALLKKEIRVPADDDLDHLDVKFILRKGAMPSMCNECQCAELPGADKKIPGWCYVSDDGGKFSFHVYCLMQMWMKTAKIKDDGGGGCDRGCGGGGGSHGVGKNGNQKLEMDRKKREIKDRSQKKGGGRRGGRSGFYMKMFKSILAAVVSVLIGDPTTLLANAAIQLITLSL